MTDSLYICVREGALSEAQLERIVNRAKEECSRVVPNGLRSHLRVVRHQGDGAIMEPFFGSAALRAVLGHSRKRDYATAAVRALVRAIQSMGHAVDLLFESERPRKKPGSPEIIDCELDDVLAIRKLPVGNVVYRLGRTSPADAASKPMQSGGPSGRAADRPNRRGSA